MKVVVTEQPIEELQSESLVITVFEGDKTFADNLAAGSVTLSEEDFSGKLYETFLIPSSSKTPKILLVGAGKKTDFDSRIERNVAGAAARRLLKNKVKKVAFDAKNYSQPELIIEGVGLAEFDPGIYKSGKNKPNKFDELQIVGKLSASEQKKAQAVVEATNWVRQLIIEPANQLTPKHIVDEGRKLARDYKFAIEVYDEKQAARAGMGAFVGIAKGSHEPSFMMSLKYIYSKTAPTLGVVGKGITFDEKAREMLFGANNPLEVGRPVAAKTGTGQDFKNAWTVGYTPSLLALAWVGNNDGAPMKDIWGLESAALIWNRFMKDSLSGSKVEQFNQPEGLEKEKICSLDGSKAVNGQPTVEEIFVIGDEPTEVGECGFLKSKKDEEDKALQEQEKTRLEEEQKRLEKEQKALEDEKPNKREDEAENPTDFPAVGDKTN